MQRMQFIYDSLTQNVALHFIHICQVPTFNNWQDITVDLNIHMYMYDGVTMNDGTSSHYSY